MATVRVCEQSAGAGRHRFEVTVAGRPDLSATATLGPVLSAADRERVQWYLERYPETPGRSATAIAAEVERRLLEVSTELLDGLFGSPGGRAVWGEIEADVKRMRFEVVLESAAADAIPWELLGDPRGGAMPALGAASFVRVRGPSHAPAAGPRSAGPLRVLLAICRPAVAADVPFQAVARSLLALGDEFMMETDVLRPATLPALEAALGAAAGAGRPYDIVHFDGHGYHLAVLPRHGQRAPWEDETLLELIVSPPQPGERGYVCFEDPARPGNTALVDGTALGRALRAGDVRLLVLNACRSDYVGHDPEKGSGSLAQEVLEAGVPAVVAMRYSVLVSAASRFAAAFYRSLLAGSDVGGAVVDARRILSADPVRRVAARPVMLQDWIVPAGYEAQPLTLAPPTAAKRPRSRRSAVPPDPPAVFVGRDETILALDRAFVRHGAVLLHGIAGCGKTATAAAFARWYVESGGVPAAVFGPAADDRARSDRISALWVWDGCEALQDPRAAVREAVARGAKVLVTARGPEPERLGDAVARVPMPPMREDDCRELAAAFPVEPAVLPPLLRFAAGNPLTLEAVLRRAVQDGLATADDAEDLVGRMRSGTVEDPSLSGSLGRDLANAFNEQERTSLAVLHLFERSVVADVLVTMGARGALGSVRELRKLDRDGVVALLDRATAAGLLTADGSGYYTLHPAAPGVLAGLFRSHFGSRAQAAAGAFVRGVVTFAGYWASEDAAGRVMSTTALAREEHNLLSCVRLAGEHAWWWLLPRLASWLSTLYLQAGRQADAEALMARVGAQLLDPDTDEPLPHCDEQTWVAFIDVRVRVAIRLGHLAEGIRLQRGIVHGWRSVETDDPEAVRGLADAVVMLGHLYREAGRPEAARCYEEAIGLQRRLEDDDAVAATSYNMGRLMQERLGRYEDAARWYRQALALAAPDDVRFRTRIQAQVGALDLDRLAAARTAQRPTHELAHWAGAALSDLTTALDQFPPDAVDDRAVVHANLARAYDELSQHELAEEHLATALQHYEHVADRRAAGIARQNLAVHFANLGRLDDARVAATAAIDDLADEPGAAEAVEKLRALVAQIDRDADGG